MDDNKQEVTIRTACKIHSFSCGLLAKVSNGTITRILPADFPDQVDRGACLMGMATPEMVYHPDRLRYPLKRVGKRGEGEWQRVTWNEALDDISAKLQEIMQQHGSSSVAWTFPAPMVQSLTGAGFSRLASLTKSGLVTWESSGDNAGPCGDAATFGWPQMQRILSRSEDPRYHIVWGLNPAATSIHIWKKIRADQKKGCKVVVVDPRLTESASHADQHISLRPGTDTALALGMIHVIFEQALQDERFIEENTVGPLLVRGDNGLLLRESDLTKGGGQQRYMVIDSSTGQPQPCGTAGVQPKLTGRYSVSGIDCQPAYQLLVNVVKEYTPEKTSEITEVPAEVIRRLATEFATTRPASIRRGYGVQRYFYSDMTFRAINTLAAITGNVQTERPAPFLNWGSFLAPGGPTNIVPVVMLYDAITRAQPTGIKGLFIAGRNFVNQMPDMNRMINEVLPHLGLIVVSDLFMTATARQADYVLPAASFLECVDVRVTVARHSYLTLQQKVIEPLYESKTDFQIAAELGRRMGFAQYFDKSEEEYLEEILATGRPEAEAVSMEMLREGSVPAKPLGKPHALETPTGRIEFYVERLKQFGQELPVFLENLESNRSDKAKKYPFTLLSTHPKYRKHSSMANIPSIRKKDPEPLLEINPADAEPRGIGDRDPVCVFNDRGTVKLRAKLDPRMRPGVLNIEEGWWPEHFIEGHLNQLTHARLNPVQQFVREANAALHDVLVGVKKTEAGTDERV